MPRLAGTRLIEMLIEAHPELKVLFLSGYTMDAIARYGIKEGTHAFLQKPFTSSMLSQAVREVLDTNAVNRAKTA